MSNQDNKTRFQQIMENEMTVRTSVQNIAAEQYAAPSHTRNICFAWSDGGRIFLNYGYLVAGHYLPDDNSITLRFTTHQIVLKGLRLENLFMELMDQMPRIITCIDERYKTLADKSAAAVQEIIVIPLE